MLTSGAELWIELPSEAESTSERHRCVVLQGGEALARIEFLDAAPAVHVGQRGRVYFESEDGFVSCMLQVREISAEGPVCLIGLRGDPQPARSREYFRLRIEDRELWCTLAGERCQVISLSPGGLGVVSGQEHAVGKLLELVVYDGLETVRGRVCVVNRSEGPEACSVLYGLRLAPGVSETHSPLATRLSRLCAELQLEQRRLRRDRPTR